jgi:hypothetical protein
LYSPLLLDGGLYRLETLWNASLSFGSVYIVGTGGSNYLPTSPLRGLLYNTSMSFVHVHIFGTGGFNYFSMSYGGSKRSREYDIVYAQFSSHYDGSERLETLYNASLPFVDVQVVLKLKDPIHSMVDQKVVKNVK